MSNPETENSFGMFIEKDDDDLIICRCEEITKGEIRKAVYEGMITYNMVKRYLRAGMGLCQGQSCQTNVRRIIAEELNQALTEVGYSTPRPPLRPVKMESYRQDCYCVPQDMQSSQTKCTKEG